MNSLYEVSNLKCKFCGCTSTFKGCLLSEAPMLSYVLKPAENLQSPKTGQNFDVFGAGDPRNVNLKALNYEKARVSIEPRRLSHQAWESDNNCDLWAGWGNGLKKGRKKSQDRETSPPRGGATSQPILTNFGMFVHVTEVITPAKCGFENFNSFCMPAGIKIGFPYRKAYGLYNMPCATALACDRITSDNLTTKSQNLGFLFANWWTIAYTWFM